MKCKKPGTDQELSLQILINGMPCPEYDLPGSIPPDGDTVYCFIPVSNGDQFSIKGHFKGTCLHGAIDVLLDGAFAKDRRIEVDKDGQPTYCKAAVNVDNAFDYTKPYEQRIVEGNIHVQPITRDDFQMAADGSELGVGTLAFIVSVNQMSDDTYKHEYASKYLSAWKEDDREPINMATGGIAPTHEIELISTNKPVTGTRKALHKRHFDQLRFGNKPWAKVIFYYRSYMAIEAEGCKPRPDHFVDLEAAEDGTFVAAEKTKRKSTAKATTISGDNDSEGDEIAVQHRASTGLFVSPSPGYEEPGLRYTDTGEGTGLSDDAADEEVIGAENDQNDQQIGETVLQKRNAVDGTEGSDAPSEAQIVRTENDQADPANAEIRIKTEPAEKLKRPLPEDSVSRDSTPSKRARISELQAKKAALVAANQEKLQRKLAAEKKLQDDRKKRAAEEEELLRQIAEMEREGRKLDDATEEILRTSEMENDQG